LAGMGAVWPSARAKSVIAPSICSRLVTQMRGSPATVLKDQSVPKMLPWIVNAVSRPAEGEPVYRYLPRIWRTMGGRGATFPTIESLPGTDLSMVSAIAGSGDCLQLSFFEWKQGSAFRAIDFPPMSLDSLCSRDGVWGGLAAVLGQPAFIAYGSLDPSNMDSLLVIAPWDGKRWGRACPVSIRFRYRYDLTRLYCGAFEAVCDAARKVAAKVKRRYDTWATSSAALFNDLGRSAPRFQFGGPPSARGQALVARARLVGTRPRKFAPGSDAGRAWLRQLVPNSTEYFPLTLDGNLYAGAASLSRRTKFTRPDWLFIVFQPPSAGSRRLVPLAAFKVHRVTSGVRSITARNESASANEMQSTKIPIF
ncbi:MAG: hypothetical protein ACRETJ_03305, partial [Steroidobacteraceae bacterium]